MGEVVHEAVMILMVHTLSWGVVSEDRIEYRTMQECKHDIEFMWLLMPKDEFGFDGFVECRPKEKGDGT